MKAPESVSLPGGAGYTLPVNWYPADRASGAVVLMAALGMGARFYQPLAKALQAAGLNVALLEQRGHGESDWDPEGNYDRVRYADDVIELAAGLASPPVLVGASLGGMSSLMGIHRAESDIARALVLVDIATRMEPEGLERIFKFMQADPMALPVSKKRPTQ